MKEHVSMLRSVKAYIQYRRQIGCDLQSSAQLLLRFAKYADRCGHRGAITTELAIRWARRTAGVSAGYLVNRLGVVRGFAKYQLLFDPRTEIPPAGAMGVTVQRKTPYIYTPTEIHAIIRASGQLPPAGSLRPHTFATLFALLACTGMRHREALRLKRFDIDWDRRLLHINRTKFCKSRLIPLHISTIKGLARYSQLRDQYFPEARSDAYFVSMRGTALAQPTVHNVFSLLRVQLGWTSLECGRRPRIHDLRHTFACRRLLEWHQRGIDVEHAFASLSTYLGHADISHTYWYLTGVPELLELANSRFECFASL